jgi:TolB protein
LLRDDRDISFDVSGDRIVFNAAGEGERDLFLLDLSTGEVKQPTHSKAREYDPRFAPDGQQIVYAAYPSSDTAKPSSIYSLDLRSNRVARLTNSPFADYKPHYLPDGKTLLFGRAHRLRPYSLDAP